MKFARYALMAAVLILLLACGGGGGGGSSTGTTITLTGRIVSVVTTGPLNPAATVSSGSASTTTQLGDGSFSLDTPTGVTSITSNNGTSGFGPFTFTFPAATATTDLGDLYVGPENVRVTGTVRNSVTNAVIPNATISYAGRNATTNASGQFTLVDVAYSSATQTGFWGIFGNVAATGFFASDFTANGKTASSGLVTVDDISLVPVSDDPPGTPYNIYGQVLPAATGESATVTLSQGATTVRTTTAGTNGTFFFWVPAGTYTIAATKDGVNSPGVNVTLTSNNQIVRKDVNF